VTFGDPRANASRERLEEVSRVQLPESANPTVYGIDRCSWASELSTGIRQLANYLHSATIFSRLLTRSNET
jgi:hypothetical protein